MDVSFAIHLDEVSLASFARGVLAPPEQQKVREHAADCPTCRNVLAALKRGDPEATVIEDSGGGSKPPSAGTLAAPAQELVGQQVGEYVVEEVLGAGGMGLVYRGRHPLIGKPVAIKVLRPEIAADPVHVQALLAEARAASEVSHRAVVDIFAFGKLPDGRQYMVMEYLTGQPLNTIVKERAPLPPLETLALLDGILSALEAVHEAGMVHRDLKPSNLFILKERDGHVNVKLLDFGLARTATSTSLHTGSVLLGTPAYMSPEQIGGAQLDGRTDLYALGVIAYELCTRVRPFRAENIYKLMQAHVEEAPKAPRSVNPAVPPALDGLILRLLEKDRDARPATATLVRAQLRALTTQLEAQGLTGRSRRSGLVRLIGGGAAIGAVGALAWLLSSAGGDASVLGPDHAAELRRATSPVAPLAPATNPPTTDPPTPSPPTPSPPTPSPPTTDPPPPNRPATGAARPTAAHTVSFKERAARARKRLIAAAPEGEDPDAMALMLLSEAERMAVRDPAGAEKLLKDVERKYLRN